MLLACSTAGHAGELWVDYFEERFPICPSPSDPSAVIDERGAEFVREMVYELDKTEQVEDPTELRFQSEIGPNGTRFDVEKQRIILDRFDSARFFLTFLIPPIERVERIEFDETGTISIRVADAYLPTGAHAPLREAFAAMVIEQPQSNAPQAPPIGPLLYEYLDARARAYAELPGDGIEPSGPIESAELRGALSDMQEAYAALRPSLLALVDRPDFAMRLEEHIWARCSVAAQNEDGQ